MLVGKPRHIQYLADRDIRRHFFEFVAAAVLVGVNSIKRAYADRPLDYRLVRDNTQIVDARNGVAAYYVVDPGSAGLDVLADGELLVGVDRLGAAANLPGEHLHAVRQSGQGEFRRAGDGNAAADRSADIEPPAADRAAVAVVGAGNYGDTGFAAEVFGFSGDIHRFRPGVPLLDAVQRGAVLSEVQHFDEHNSVKHYLVP